MPIEDFGTSFGNRYGSPFRSTLWVFHNAFGTASFSFEVYVRRRCDALAREHVNLRCKWKRHLKPKSSPVAYEFAPQNVHSLTLITYRTWRQRNSRQMISKKEKLSINSKNVHIPKSKNHPPSSLNHFKDVSMKFFQQSTWALSAHAHGILKFFQQSAWALCAQEKTQTTHLHLRQ